MKTFAYAASSTSPSRSTSSGTASSRAASSSSRRRSRHLCAPSPPGSTAGARATGSGAGSRRAARPRARPGRRPGPGLAAGGQRRHAEPLQRRRPRPPPARARAGPRAAAGRRASSTLRAQARQVRASVHRHAAAHEDRLEDAERRVGAVGAARRARAPARRGVTRGSSTSRAPAAAITGRAFTKHSSSSRSRDRVGHDAAAGAHPDPLAAQLERPDRHVQLEARHRARVADRAGVRLAAAGLELGDHAHRLDLGRAGDRAGREARAQQVGVARVLAQRARAPSRRGARPRAPAAARSAPARGPSRTRTRARGRCA